MNRLPIAKRIQILRLLVEGSSMRSIEQILGCSINTVTKCLCEVGAACAAYHDANVRGLKTKKVQCDEIWAFCYARTNNVKGAKSAPDGAGDVWTWTAIDADSKLIVSYLVGERDAEYANEFIHDVRHRLGNRAQLTTDGHSACQRTVEGSIDSEVGYVQRIKLYANTPDRGNERHSPAGCTGTKKAVNEGEPEIAKVSTSYAERNYLTMRKHMRRSTQLTNTFARKIESHANAVALHFMYYNFAMTHKSLRATPAMEAGISDHVWSLEEIARLVPEPVPAKRGPYKPRQNAISN